MDFVADRRGAVDLLQQLSAEGIAISLITYCEVLEGVYNGREPLCRRRLFQSLLRTADLLPLNRPIMQRAAQIRGHLRKTGRRIGDMDTLIAATAVYHRLTLVTRNTREFQRVPGLTLMDA